MNDTTEKPLSKIVSLGKRFARVDSSIGRFQVPEQYTEKYFTSLRARDQSWIQSFCFKQPIPTYNNKRSDNRNDPKQNKIIKIFLKSRTIRKSQSRRCTNTNRETFSKILRMYRRRGTAKIVY